MGRFIKYRPSPAMVIGFIALFAALSGTASALRGTNLVTSNDIRTGAVKKSDVGRDSVGKSEAREDDDAGGGFGGAQINEQSLDTVPSARGLRHWGVINSNGSFVRGAGVTQSVRTGTGQYELTFNQAVTGCAFLATLGRPSSLAPQAGEIGVGHAISDNGLRVRTWNSAGNLSDRSFHIALSCPFV